MSNFKQFVSEMKTETKGVYEKVDLIRRKIALQALRAVVLGTRGASLPGTPVGNPSLWKEPESAPEGYTGGQARGNWQVTIGVPATGVIPFVDENGNATVRKGQPVINSDPPLGVPIFLTNNLPYIKSLEEGHSTQAPQGFVGLAVHMINMQFAKVK